MCIEPVAPVFLESRAGSAVGRVRRSDRGWDGACRANREATLILGAVRREAPDLPRRRTVRGCSGRDERPVAGLALDRQTYERRRRARTRKAMLTRSRKPQTTKKPPTPTTARTSHKAPNSAHISPNRRTRSRAMGGLCGRLPGPSSHRSVPTATRKNIAATATANQPSPANHLGSIATPVSHALRAPPIFAAARGLRKATRTAQGRAALTSGKSTVRPALPADWQWGPLTDAIV